MYHGFLIHLWSEHKHLAYELQANLLQGVGVPAVIEAMVNQLHVEWLHDNRCRELHQVCHQMFLHVKRCAVDEVLVIFGKEHVIVAKDHLVDQSD